MIDMLGFLVYGIEPAEVIAALKNGREAIKIGWCRKTARRVINGNDHYCAVGAAYCQKNLDEEITRKVQHCACELLKQYYQEVIRDPKRKLTHIIPDTVIEWNDELSDKRPVINLYDGLIGLMKKTYDL